MLSIPTADTPELIMQAKSTLLEIFKQGFSYQRYLLTNERFVDDGFTFSDKVLQAGSKNGTYIRC
jgi:hypothetical protein